MLPSRRLRCHMGLPSPAQASSGISHYLDRVHSNQEVGDAASPMPGEQRCCEQQAGPGLRVHLIGHASQAASLCTKAANTDSPFLLSSSHGPKLGRLLASFQLQQQDLAHAMQASIKLLASCPQWSCTQLANHSASSHLACQRCLAGQSLSAEHG